MLSDTLFQGPAVRPGIFTLYKLECESWLDSLDQSGGKMSEILCSCCYNNMNKTFRYIVIVEKSCVHQVVGLNDRCEHTPESPEGGFR